MTQNDSLSLEREVIILGASGHAKVVIDAVEKQAAYRIRGLLDDAPQLEGQYIYNYKVLGGVSPALISKDDYAFIAIGDNQIRFNIVNWLEENQVPVVEAIVHPFSQPARGVSIGKGSILMAGSVINSDTVVGENTIINTGATVDHDCMVGDVVHVAPGATICGGVTIGDLTLIGAGSVIRPNINIGKNVTVGAGSTVLCDVADGMSVVGTPAKVRV